MKWYRKTAEQGDKLAIKALQQIQLRKGAEVMKWLFGLSLILGLQTCAWAASPVLIKYTDQTLIWVEDVTFVLDGGTVATPDSKQLGMARVYQRYGVGGLAETSGGLELLVPKGGLDRLDEKERTMLAIAAGRGHDVILQALLEAGANPNVRCNQQLTALHYAIQGREAFSAKTLLRYGADPSAKDEQGWMPLHHAAWDGVGSCVVDLVKAGADVNAYIPTGETALQIALQEANVKTASALVFMGANVKVKWAKSGATTLMLAMELRDATELVMMLLEGGVDVNAVPRNGLTAFYTAVMMDDVPLMELLLKHGAKINEPTSKWKTALEVARHYKSARALQWLEQH